MKNLISAFLLIVMVAACGDANSDQRPRGQLTLAQVDSTLMASRHNAITLAVARATDAVVSVTVTEMARDYDQELIDRFFGNFYSPGILREYKSLGSGFIISEDGLVVTNQHVVGVNAVQVMVTLSNGESHKAEIIGIDELTDLSLLKINTDRPLPFMEFGNSDGIMVGEWCIAMGNPFGLFEDGTPTVTVGVVSAIDRDFRPNPRMPRVYSDMIQTDASINSGNSGGPLLNALGEVIGVNTFIFTVGTSDGFVGLGFAIPSNRVVRIIEQLRDSGIVLPRFDLGMELRNISFSDARQYYLPYVNNGNGVYVFSVNRDGPAYESGIMPGDIIWKLENQVIYSKNYYEALMRDYNEGDTVRVEIYRGGENGGLYEASVILKAKVLAEG
jgi:serine protease Do